MNIWQALGHQPRRNDLQNEHSEFSQGPYKRRFKSWTNALEAFIQYMNENDSINYKKAEKENINNIRDPSLRLRYKILKRDNFKCCICGRNPANDPTIELHIDHIIPYSKGGETIESNLRTLCSDCNLGKSDIV